MSPTTDASRDGAQREAARRRFEATQGERDATREAMDRLGVAVHDTPEELEARALRLLATGEAPAEAVVRVAMREASGRSVAYERIIGASNDLQSVSFLGRGARAAATVARISVVDGGRVLPVGTGFLVSPRLLVTNNHVLPDEGSAAVSVVEFCAEVDLDHQPAQPCRFRTEPATFFATDPHLDVTVVALAPSPGSAGGTDSTDSTGSTEGTLPGHRFGWNRCVRQTGKIVTGEPVNVVGHPMGRLKEISVRNNRLVLQLEDFLHYESDTEPGNSGSPVFNDQWEVVALHHSGVPLTDDAGRYLRKDGQVWQPGDGDDAICWVANEGARLSKVLDWLAALDLDEARRAVLAEMGEQAWLSPPSAPGGAPAAEGPRRIDLTSAAQSLPSLPEQRLDGRRSRPAGPAGSRDGVQLVFVHGRGQAGRDPARLRTTWAAGLNAGLTRAGLPTLDARSAWFPFYGDVLADVLRDGRRSGGRERLDGDVADAGGPASPTAQAVYAEMLAEAAACTGAPPDEDDLAPLPEEGWRAVGAAALARVSRQLGWLAARSRLDDATISLIFSDVASYLDPDQPTVREAVLDSVLEQMPATGPVVILSHSLGTVVAMDVLTRLPDAVSVPLLVTAGSPLGMDAVTSRLLAGGPRRPQRVEAWVNAWCPADPVAIGCPLRKRWGAELTELVTDNDRDRSHDITEYVGDPRVAAAVAAATTTTAAPRQGENVTVTLRV